MLKRRNSLLIVWAVLFVLALAVTACTAPATPDPTRAPDPTAVPAEPVDQPTPAEPMDEPAPVGLSCAEPIKVGLITDATGPLAIYGAHILRSFMLGMEYAAGAPGSAGEVFSFSATQQNTFQVGDCEIQVLVRDDQGVPETTAEIARELVEVQRVNVLVGTVSSGATATLQGVASQNRVPLIVAPAAANDITGIDFNEYTFRTSRNNYQDAINLCEYLPTVFDTFVQIAPDYSFGYGGAAAFRDACTLSLNFAPFQSNRVTKTIS